MISFFIRWCFVGIIYKIDRWTYSYWELIPPDIWLDSLYGSSAHRNASTNTKKQYKKGRKYFQRAQSIRPKTFLRLNLNRVTYPPCCLQYVLQVVQKGSIQHKTFLKTCSTRNVISYTQHHFAYNAVSSRQMSVLPTSAKNNHANTKMKRGF